MAKSKRKRVPKTVLKLPDLEQSKSAVFNEQCPGGFPTALLDLSSKESSNFPVAFQKESYHYSCWKPKG